VLQLVVRWLRLADPDESAVSNEILILDQQNRLEDGAELGDADDGEAGEWMHGVEVWVVVDEVQLVSNETRDPIFEFGAGLADQSDQVIVNVVPWVLAEEHNDQPRLLD
jgi:hypothetical protein